MVEYGWRRLAGAGSILLVGVATLLVHLVHLTVDWPSVAVVWGVLAPMALSVALVGAGVGLFAGDVSDDGLLRVARWTWFGAAGGVVLGYPVVPYQAAHGVQMADTVYVMVNFLTAGALAGLVIGRYDARGRRYGARLADRREELRRREAELRRESERLETLASVVSHDLRNPLNVAAGRIEMARETGDVDHLDAAARAVDRMAAMVDDLVTMARQGEAIEDAEAEPLDLGAVARDCWTDCSAGDADDLVVETDRRLRADERRARHVFENLYRNAVEHSDGPVTVRVGALEDGFYVEDDGPGISSDEREDVFEPGYTTAADGTGLGLYIVETIVAAHGWDVTLTESSEGGARFEFTGVEEP
ncbi:MAG: sensor histidine kinase [Halobacteriaceae archaeon]